MLTETRIQVDKEMRQGAELFAHLKQLLKLCLRQRDKKMMLQIIEEVSKEAGAKMGLNSD